MTLYGSTPDALASSQQNYDRLYGAANQANANAVTQAQMEQLRMALAAREQQQRANEVATQQDWQARQNAMDRAQRSTDVAMQYAGATKLDQNKQQEYEFNNAAKDANNGSLPADPNKLRTLYPHFNDSQINQLYQLAGSAAVSKVQYAANAADKNYQAPDPSMLDAAGVPKGTEFEKQAHQIITILRAPYEQQYTQGDKLASAGNALAKIKADQTAVAANPVSTSSGVIGDAWDSLKSAVFPWRSSYAVPSQDVIQPSPESAARLAVLNQNFNTALAEKQPLVKMDSGGYVPSAPASWRPLSAMPVPAPVQAQAQAAPTPPVAAPPAPSPEKRVANQIYSTPKGVFKWSGTDWIPVR